MNRIIGLDLRKVIMGIKEVGSQNARETETQVPQARNKEKTGSDDHCVSRGHCWNGLGRKTLWNVCQGSNSEDIEEIFGSDWPVTLIRRVVELKHDQHKVLFAADYYTYPYFFSFIRTLWWAE